MWDYADYRCTYLISVIGTLNSQCCLQLLQVKYKVIQRGSRTWVSNENKTQEVNYGRVVVQLHSFLIRYQFLQAWIEVQIGHWF